jgi:lipoprotein-releasing system ATP-binding protein
MTTSAETYRESSATTGKPLVVVRELCKSFLHMGHALEVLRSIDLEIAEGEVVAIVGKSGAGKSTLLQCIGTLDLATSGVLRLGDDYLVGLSRADVAGVRNRMIGFVFQFHHLLPEFNALENVMMPGLIQGLGRPKVEKRARELLEDVGLTARATHRPGELSGGEQQRVALARALLLHPKLILADEPTGNLDTATSDAIHRLFFDINKKHGTTIVVVTHNVKLAEQMPRVITMLDGKIVDDTRETPDPFVVEDSVLERSRAIAKVTYAGFWPRAGARFVDYLVWLIGGAIGAIAGGAVVGLLAGSSPTDVAPLVRGVSVVTWGTVGLFATLSTLVAQAVSEWLGCATVGKMLFGLRVREENLDRPSFLAALIRNLLYFVDSIFFGLVGYVGMSGSLLKQRFGDGLAQTVVVKASTLPPGGSQGAWLGIGAGFIVSILLHALTVVAVRML